MISEPESCFCRPAMIESSVLFPAPDFPVIPTKEPSLIEKLKFLSTSIRPRGVMNDLFRFIASIILSPGKSLSSKLLLHPRLPLQDRLQSELQT